MNGNERVPPAPPTGGEPPQPTPPTGGPTGEQRPAPEREPAVQEMVALQARMLLGGDAINPENRNVQPVTREALGSFQQRSYNLFTRASTLERGDYWRDREENDYDRQRKVWVENTVGIFTQAQAFFTQSEQGQRWQQALNRIGINPTQMNAERINALYDTYFTGNHRISQVKQFVHNVMSAYRQGDQINLQDLRRDLPAIQWVAGIFGENSSEIITQLIDAEVKLQTEPEPFIKQINENQRINNLQGREPALLAFLWRYQQQQTLTPPQPEPTRPPQPEPQPQPPTPEPQPPQPEPPQPAAEQRPMTPQEHLTPQQIFETIQGPVATNHRFYVENPPEQVTIVDDQLTQLESRLPFFVNIRMEGNRMSANTNRDVVPWAFEIGPGTNTPVARFVNGEAFTYGDSGIVGVSAAGSNTPEKQARMYRAITDAVLRTHEHNPQLMQEWLTAQGPPSSRPDQPVVQSSTDVIGEHQVQEYTRRNGNRNYINIPFADDGNGINYNAARQLWQERVQELRKLLSNNQPLQLYHLRWIEFLSHSVNVPRVIETMRS